VRGNQTVAGEFDLRGFANDVICEGPVRVNACDGASSVGFSRAMTGANCSELSTLKHARALASRASAFVGGSISRLRKANVKVHPDHIYGSKIRENIDVKAHMFAAQSASEVDVSIAAIATIDLPKSGFYRSMNLAPCLCAF
jgi:hypothetical protein